MNNDLISRKALLKDARRLLEGQVTDGHVYYLHINAVEVAAIKAAPAVDAVLLGVFEQVKWERDTAIAQLKELGLGFGQKKPDMVEVIRCKDCAEYIPWGDDRICGRIGSYHGNTKPDDFCSRGRKRE